MYAWENGLWHYCKHMPFASMVGCARPVEKRIGYMGDSITQDCGTGVNTYTHWNAVQPHISKYGPHPDGAGCAVWAEALYQAIMASDLLK